MAITARKMRRIRQIHLYVGLFFTPLVLLFSLSGALQTFRLHEARAPTASTPPAWIVWMAAVHKDQAMPGPRHPENEHDTKTAPKHRSPIRPFAKEQTRSKLSLKILVAVMSGGLILSTILGVTIALNNPSTRGLSVLLLAAGTAMPLVLLWR